MNLFDWWILIVKDNINEHCSIIPNNIMDVLQDSGLLDEVLIGDAISLLYRY